MKFKIHPAPTPSRLRTLSLLALLSLSLTACPAPNTSAPEPSASYQPYPSAEPSAEPSSEPSAEPTAEPSAEPSTAATPGPSASPSTDLGPQPSPTPSTASEIYDYRQNFFQNYGVNPFVEADTDPLSTFSVDVDTASYTLARSYLNQGLLPPPESVRTEEYLNFFDYHYAQPLSGKFAIQTDLAPSYFGDSSSRLLRVGLQGLEILNRNRKQAILTFAIDVSGSMNQDNRLNLVKQSLKLLLGELNPDDQVTIVIYGNQARTVLKPTPVSRRSDIEQIIDDLRPEGSTNAEAGLSLAYDLASQTFVSGAINRVILCSDGVANVGETGPEAILERIQSEAKQGITLTTLGFGLNGYNDVLMEQLADKGDGNYAYLDSLDEARRLFIDQLTGTLQVIAYDSKVQVQFNPELVDQYRLLGYENRDIADEDFRNDNVDAGEVGSSHAVTALYEVRFKPEAQSGEIAKVLLRYRDADDDRIHEMSHPIGATDLTAFADTSTSYKLATAVAEFAEILRHSVFARDNSLADVMTLAQQVQQAWPEDPKVSEFVSLVAKAQALSQPPASADAQTLLAQSDNPDQLPNWPSYLLKQLGGKQSQGL